MRFITIFAWQIEQDSVRYQHKVVELRDQLSEATKQIDAMAGEYVQVYFKRILLFFKNARISYRTDEGI